ncbi:phasin [Paraburkholderia aromaticivorans]|uniref:Phasin n=2 Tax=Paraburkholderia aromaticivorans TaxID=2026199 RepID=A0A248VJ46_9BURK|nr:phasin [Paraburkholderia aromaticivorans]
MAQIIPGQWLDMESAGFDNLFSVTTRSFEAFERLAALNLQALRFGLAETQEAMARACTAGNLPEVFCLPTLLAPVGVAQALSYSRQFFEILSDFQRAAAPPVAGAGRQRHCADSLTGSPAMLSPVPVDVTAEPAMSATPAVAGEAASTTQHEKKPLDGKAIQPMHTE